MLEFIGKSESADKYIRIWCILLVIGVIGAAKPVIFNGGSSMAKYIAKQNQLQMVDEEKVEDYFQSAVFGEQGAELGSVDTVDEPERIEIVERIFLVDKGIAWMIVFGALSLLVPKVRNATPTFHFLLMISFWLFLISVGSMLNGGKKFSELAIMAHATRWGLPLFLWYLLFNRQKVSPVPNAGRYGIWILMICSSLTFAVHGVEAWLLNPPFQDLIYSFSRFFNVDLSAKVIHIILRLIGTMDLIFAVLVIVKRSRVVCLRMAMWGFITALSRPVTMGFDAWPEFAMRIANGALPLVLFYIYHLSRQEKKQSETNETNKELTYEEA